MFPPFLPQLNPTQASELEIYVSRLQQWSVKAQGGGQRTHGILKTIRMRARQIESNPKDLMAWLDIVNMALDGAWRMGYTTPMIVEALKASMVQRELSVLTRSTGAHDDDSTGGSETDASGSDRAPEGQVPGSSSA